MAPSFILVFCLKKSELLGRNINTHYVLVEAEEVANESNVDKPLIYWTNGGRKFFED